ncbi:MarR family winged helix-turn-helix transcriptional regulator [Camelimonas sp. ID_303_24]
MGQRAVTDTGEPGGGSAQASFADTIMVRDACLCLHIQRAARVLARRFDEAFRPFNLTNGQFSLLMALNRPEPPTIGAVATVLASDRTTLTAALKPLERRGLVTAQPDAKDKRSRRLQLTPAGRALLGEALPVWKSEHAALEARLAAAGFPAAALRLQLAALDEA